MCNVDVWRSVFPQSNSTAEAVFINAVITDSDNSIYSNDWASYTDAKALLGFVQYVFLPTVFYKMTHENVAELYTPIMDYEDMLALLEVSGNPVAGEMMLLYKQIHTCWGYSEQRLRTILPQLCKAVNTFLAENKCPAKLVFYATPLEIAKRMVNIYWCEEVLQEETGLGHKELFALCAMAQAEPFYQNFLLYFLNENIDCLV